MLSIVYSTARLVDTMVSVLMGLVMMELEVYDGHDGEITNRKQRWCPVYLDTGVDSFQSNRRY